MNAINEGGLAVTVLACIDPVQRDTTSAYALIDTQGTVVVKHDIDSKNGRIRRVVTDLSGVLEDVFIPLEHTCLGCATRADMLPTLKRLAQTRRWQRALLALPVSAEPLTVAQAIQSSSASEHAEIRLGSIVSVAEADTLVEDLMGTATLRELGLELSGKDSRSVGEALAHQIETSDLVMLTSCTQEPTDDHHHELLDHLVESSVVRCEGTGSINGATLMQERTQAGPAWHRADPLACKPTGAEDTHRVWTLDLATWKPLHPERLQDEIEEMGAGRLRGRGHFWLPGRSAEPAGWDCAGGQLSLGNLGGWGHKPRGTRIVVTGDDPGDKQRVEAAFERCELTDAEMARGRQWWEKRDDGFDPWLGERVSAT